MAKLGFLGLGIMGYPMARNLLRAGHEVALWSNTASKAKELAATEKGKFCSTPKEVAGNADCIFLCVGDTAMSERDIKYERITRVDRDIGDAAAHDRRSNRTRLQILEQHINERRRH